MKDGMDPTPNAFIFTCELLDGFDLDISRMAIYNSTYYKRQANYFIYILLNQPQMRRLQHDEPLHED